MEVKVVTGCSYGDEGKGLVSGCLAREAINRGQKVLTVFYNGTIQRSHTFMGVARHCEGAGAAFGEDTFYYKTFVIDPIALWLTKTSIIIDPRCRLIFPCDVLHGRAREKHLNHGSCGFGLFAAVKRDKEQHFEINDIFYPPATLLYLIKKVDSYYKYMPDELYNFDNFFKALGWIKDNCQISTFEDIIAKEYYDTIIFEGGQGLLLDQENKGDFPHLTPSSTGAFNIHEDIEKLGVRADLFYVSRSYITRHGRGPMDKECEKEEINSNIIDRTNQNNEWQGKLRFGLINIEKLNKRIKGDANRYNCDKTINMVFTHLNYTKNQIASTEGKIEIARPEFVDFMWGSNKKDFMEEIII